jgi:hypothetical protein
VQTPLAICGQSVLAAATLVVQGHADVKLPIGQTRAIAGYYFTVAATGERKTSVDTEALWPVRAHEAKLREAYDPDQLVYANKLLAWEKARDTVVKRAKGDRNAIEAGLNALGASPRPPLVPLLTCSEPTYEGLCKLLAVSGPSLGVFAAEGGQFVGGHGMSDDAKLRTAAGLSAVWDGEPIKRVRAEGTLVMPGRRVTMHLMVQPDVAGMMLNDPLLADHGLLSRVLVTAPEPASGTRLWREPPPETERRLQQYRSSLATALVCPLPLVSGTQNTLAPRVLLLSPAAQRVWIAFYNHIEQRLGSGYRNMRHGSLRCWR